MTGIVQVLLPDVVGQSGLVATVTVVGDDEGLGDAPFTV